MRNQFTVARLIAYLNTIPEDANVSVIYEGCWEEMKVNNPDHVYYSPMENTLYFGEI